MLILSLSQDGDPHSLAAQSRIVMQNVDSRLMHIEGDLVGNLVGIPESFLYGHIDIRSWKTGEFLWVSASLDVFQNSTEPQLTLSLCEAMRQMPLSPRSNFSTVAVFLVWRTMIAWTCSNCNPNPRKK